jgi:predicted nucleic acid-binding protein
MTTALVYLDNSIIVSYIDEADSNHERAVKLIDDLSGKSVVSMLTLVRVASVYPKDRIDETLPLALDSIKSVGAELVEVNFRENLRYSILKTQA